MDLSAPIYELKRKAKLLGRLKGIPLNQAYACIAKQEGYASWGLLIRDYKETQKPRSNVQPRVGYQITSLPVDDAYLKEAIELANSTFEMVMRRIEPDNPVETRQLWDAAEYVEKHYLNSDMLPIDSEYVLYLIEAFLVGHVIDLAVQADRKVDQRGYSVRRTY